MVEQYGNEKTAKIIVALDLYKKSSGKVYAGDYNAILNWVVAKVERDEKREFEITQSLKNLNGIVEVYEYKKEEVVPFNIGDTVDVHLKIKEGNKERIQIFTGTVIKRQNSGLNETFTVRKISYGVGVEKTFPTHSPRIAKIEVKRVGKVRRARLYYLRDRVGKAAKTKEKIEQ